MSDASAAIRGENESGPIASGKHREEDRESAGSLDNCRASKRQDSMTRRPGNIDVHSLVLDGAED